MGHTPLGTDALTAFRLVMDDDGTAPVSSTLAAWSLLTAGSGARRTLAELPEEFQRREDRLVSDRRHEPIRLTPDEILVEAFRLSALRTPASDAGWHLHSNVVRAGNLLSTHTELVSLEGQPTGFASFVKNSRHVEGLIDRRDVLYVRPRQGPIATVAGEIPMVRTTVLCPGEAESRPLHEHATFGEARRALLREPTALVSPRTRIVMSRGDEALIALFDSVRRVWTSEDGMRLGRIHPGEQPAKPYVNGHLVGAMVGYVTVNRRGLVHANAGIAIDSPGDEDAIITEHTRREAPDVATALSYLRERDDIDHVFTKPIVPSPIGFWLTTFSDAPQEDDA